MPAAVAARPRDVRGYPVPAITPWDSGSPVFAATGTARTYLCAVERRCSICALPMAPGPVWRVVAGEEAAAIADALASGHEYRNLAATAEAPGHRACMLYAAVVCPYLARPQARRGSEATAIGLAAAKGSRRGDGGAVASFGQLQWRHVPGTGMLFRFAGLTEFLPHVEGADQLPALAAAVAAEAASDEVAPAYLLADEAAVDARLHHYVPPGHLPDA